VVGDTETSAERIGYSNAVVDAMHVTPDKISTNLAPISFDNTNLFWRTNCDGTIQVKVVSFMSNEKADKYYQIGPTNLHYGDQWVTAYPYLKNFCKKYQGDNKDLRKRLLKLLGMPATYDNDTVVEFWVSPDYLFRPTPEPAINSVSAGLSISTNAPLISANYRLPCFWVSWYNNNYNSKFHDPAHLFPFTQLGYTYDWGSTNHMGLSEYVIPSGSLSECDSITVPIYVEAHCPAADYGKKEH
jgi:hypothetical protein